MVKNCTEKGIEISTSSIQPWGDFYWPGGMYDLNGVIDKNIQPFKLSEVNASYVHLANYL